MEMAQKKTVNQYLTDEGLNAAVQNVNAGALLGKLGVFALVGLVVGKFVSPEGWQPGLFAFGGVFLYIAGLMLQWQKEDFVALEDEHAEEVSGLLEDLEFERGEKEKAFAAFAEASAQLEKDKRALGEARTTLERVDKDRERIKAELQTAKFDLHTCERDLANAKKNARLLPSYVKIAEAVKEYKDAKSARSIAVRLHSEGKATAEEMAKAKAREADAKSAYDSIKFPEANG